MAPNLLPVLDLPEVGYPEPRSVEDVANGVGLEPLEGQTAVLALLEAAQANSDVALVDVARGRYPGVTIRLAQNPSVLAQRVQRAISATDARPYTYKQAIAHRTGMFTGAGQRIDEWAALVIAHHTGSAPEHVVRQRTVYAAKR